MKLAVSLLALLGVAAAPADRDWPCYQRLVPKLTAASLWAGPAPQHDWRANPVVANLAAQVADRRQSIGAGVAALEQFTAAKPGAEARTELFFGLVDLSNVERDRAIERLFEVSHRLRALTDAIAAATRETAALAVDAPEAQRAEVVDRRALLIRQYKELSQTVRYACEIPVDFSHRLGQFARVLQPPQE